MDMILTGIIVLGGFGLIGLVFVVVGIYNGLIEVKENVHKAWANIDVILKQRYDEIPQLIQVCQQYVSYEEDMISKIFSAREKMVSGRSIEEKAKGFNDVSEGLKGLLAVGEAYPELKANQNFLQIQGRLSDLEERIADRREFYNDSVNIYNVRIQQVPDVFLAGLLNYRRMQMFKVSSIEKSLPDLKIRKPA